MKHNEQYKSYDEFLTSPEWKAIRSKVLERAERRCQVCNSKKSIQIHHRVYKCEWGKENLNDLIALCSNCHSLFHHVESENKPSQSSTKKSYQNKPKTAKGKPAKTYRIFYKNGTQEVITIESKWIAELNKNPLISSIRIEGKKKQKKSS